MKPKKDERSNYFDEQQQAFYLGLAKKHLAYYGNKTPSINQLLHLYSLLCQTCVHRYIAIDTRLTEQEATTLYFSAQGKTTEQIAQFSKITPRQVERHRSQIFKKLGCNNIASAIMKGIRFLELQPPSNDETNSDLQ